MAGAPMIETSDLRGNVDEILARAGIFQGVDPSAVAALTKKDNPQARALVKEARDLIAAMPVSDAQAAAPENTGAFTGSKEKGARQAELENAWAGFAKQRYTQARAKADEALKLAR